LSDPVACQGVHGQGAAERKDRERNEIVRGLPMCYIKIRVSATACRDRMMKMSEKIPAGSGTQEQEKW